MLTIETISSFNFVEWCENIEDALVALAAPVWIMFLMFAFLVVFYFIEGRK